MTRRVGVVGPGIGRGGLKRHRKMLKDSIHSALSKPAVKRLARRAGVKRISGGVVEEVQSVLRSWLSIVVPRATTYAEHARRMTVTLNDMLLSLKASGITLWGFSERAYKRRKVTQRLPQEDLQAAHAQAVRRAAMAAVREQHQQQPAQRPAVQLEAPAAAPIPPAQQADEMEAGPAVLDAGPAAMLAEEDENQQQVEQPGKEELEAPSGSPSPESPAPLTPERALEIQASLAAFQESIEGEEEPEVLVSRAFHFVQTSLRQRGSSGCSQEDFEAVLVSLERRQALMLTNNDDAGRPVMLVFT
ncbi:hypothetical protein N2152v2_008229 [Parachlorella kessleri]